MRGGKIGGIIAGESVVQNRPEHLLNYDKAWHETQGRRHEIFDRIKNGIYNFSDKKFNSIASSFKSVPYEKRTLGNLFKTALFNNPSLVIDVAKVFVVK